MSIQEKEDFAVEYPEHGLPPSSSSSAEHLDGDLLALDIRPAAERQLRAAITSARLKGLEQDLGFTDIQYQTVLAMLYVSYIPAQVPSKIILNRISRPSYYIAACVVCWGLTSALTGATNSYAGIVATRLFIGLPEAAFYPGGIYLLSRWYTKKELAFRTSIFSAGASISSACGSAILHRGFHHHRHRDSCGASPLQLRFHGYVLTPPSPSFLLPDHPHNTRWLSPAQRRLAQVRLAEDGGEADEDGDTDSVLKSLLMAIRDPKVLLFALMACCLLIGTGFANFFPMIAATLGFSTTMTLLLAAIPYVFATFLSCLNAWHADRMGERYFHITGSYGLVFFGYVLAVSTMSVPGRYIAMFLMTGGASGYTLISAWVATSIPRPPAKRSAAISIVNATGNVGTLVSSFVWKVQWGPEYHPSMFIGMAGLGLGVFLATVIRYLMARQNKILEREASVKPQIY
ncbi:MFS general substrate transporter [Polyporus arcularius HHB13444]|uniref:MFS general substrate transporter n=1 Tax=Polyporus arcularius HHB13444 TaxID=1314778 RepID=A0A5C3P443_9APHY|nr:MFS general substrate transporter [Polyporus arcularius HHB13444]